MTRGHHTNGSSARALYFGCLEELLELGVATEPDL
jgi:hypothetical protein